MKVNDWLASSQQKLIQAGIDTARLDSLVLLEDVTKLDRAWLLAHPEAEISSKDLGKLKNLLSLRLRHEPLAYIRGKTEFYGREFLITSAVLEPRPESETMIDLLKDLPRTKAPFYISDVGTGSGALGITAALEVPDATVELLEIDQAALKIAKMNVDKFTLNIKAINSDLLSGSKNNSNILLCNLPYVPDSFTVNTAAMREPKLAIFGGPDGLNIYRQLFGQVKNLSQKPLYILIEAFPSQHDLLKAIADKADYCLYRSRDFIQVYKLSEI